MAGVSDSMANKRDADDADFTADQHRSDRRLFTAESAENAEI
jgi:hypothetical protein